MPKPSITIAIRGTGHTLSALPDPELLEWIELSIQAGKLALEIRKDFEIDHLREFLLIGRLMAGMALRDYDFACSLTEDERRQVIEAQDEVNQASSINSMLNISARMHLGK